MKVKTFKIVYTELKGKMMDEEEVNEVVIETKDIKWTLEQFGRNRNIVNYDVKEIYLTGMTFFNMNRFGKVYNNTYIG